MIVERYCKLDQKFYRNFHSDHVAKIVKLKRLNNLFRMDYAMCVNSLMCRRFAASMAIQKLQYYKESNFLELSKSGTSIVCTTAKLEA